MVIENISVHEIHYFRWPQKTTGLQTCSLPIDESHFFLHIIFPKKIRTFILSFNPIFN
jgi:hypothetical protein